MSGRIRGLSLTSNVRLVSQTLPSTVVLEESRYSLPHEGVHGSCRGRMLFNV